MNLNLESEISESIQKFVDKHNTLCVAITYDKQKRMYECAIYNNGVKFVTGYDEILLLATVKALEPIMKHIESGRVACDCKLNANEIDKIVNSAASLRRQGYIAFIPVED